MKSALAPLGLAAIAAAFAAAGGIGLAQTAPGPRDFKPARVAVVDISEVFENYQKKKDIEGQLEAQIKTEEKQFEEGQEQLKTVNAELKNVQEGGAKHKELVLKKTELEFQLKNRQKEILKEFQEKQFNALKEIRSEITADIEKYAQAMEIDLVLERKVSAEGKGNLQPVHWPIVHYVKPELEITGDIIKRLNAQYRK